MKKSKKFHLILCSMIIPLTIDKMYILINIMVKHKNTDFSQDNFERIKSIESNFGK